MSTTEKEIKTVSAADQSFWANVKRQFKKNKLAVYSLRFIYVLIWYRF